MIVVPYIPYWRLSAFYFFYFALVGALNPYFGLYLSDIGFTAYAIGLVNAVLMGTKIVAPNVWGWLCDYTGKRLQIITAGSFLALVFFSGLFFWQTLAPILLVTFLYSFFWNAVISQFDTVTIQYLKTNSDRYSHVRLWGSIGFIISVVILGGLFDFFSIQYLIPIAWVLLLLIWLSCCSVKDPGKPAAVADVRHWWQLLRRRSVIAFLIAAFLLQLSFGAYYTFFSLYLELYHYSRTTIGLLWAVGVLAEVVLFLKMHRVMSQLGVEKLFFWSLLLTGIRWLMLAFFPECPALILVSQLIHALSFGAAHAACIELIRQYFKGCHAGQGNALYSSMTFGVGGALGAIGSSLLWEISPPWLFICGAIVVFIAAVVVRIYLCKNIFS